MKQFLTNIKTKGSLTIYLAEKVLQHFQDSNKVVVVSTQNGVRCNREDYVVDHLISSQEEADTLLILHSLDACHMHSTVHILSPDTDVFILAIKYLPKLGSRTCIITGAAGRRHKVLLQPIYEKLGADVAAALPGFHSFTGCDTVGRFAGRGKKSCWKTFFTAPPQIRHAFTQGFSQLGITEHPPQVVNEALEHFVCHLYIPGTKLSDVGKVRWELFRKHQAESEKLPPTKAALQQHTERANHQAMIWQNADSAVPSLPSPDGHGWTMGNRLFIPIVSKLKPAPDAILELTQCGCARAKCRTLSCSCRKAGMVCTEMCKCDAVEDSCENIDAQLPIDMVESDSDEEEDLL